MRTRTESENTPLAYACYKVISKYKDTSSGKVDGLRFNKMICLLTRDLQAKDAIDLKLPSCWYYWGEETVPSELPAQVQFEDSSKSEDGVGQFWWDGTSPEIQSKDKKKVDARLDLDHLALLRQATGIPLVLHGGSGVKREYMQAAIKQGIAKVNIGTEIRQAYESVLAAKGTWAAAQDAVYERTCWLIRDYLGLAGSRALVAC